jgi:hypothetical protein
MLTADYCSNIFTFTIAKYLVLGGAKKIKNNKNRR